MAPAANAAIVCIHAVVGMRRQQRRECRKRWGTAEKPVELIWYTIGTPQKDVDKVEEEINKYTAEKIGVTVDMKMIDFGDYNQKMQVMATSGEPMDILFTSSWAFDYVQNARKGAFMELDELIESHGKGIKDAIDPAFLEGSKVDGHNYAIPANKELPAQEAWRFNKTPLINTTSIFRT